MVKETFDLGEKLPPLITDMAGQREKIESDSCVKSLVKSNFLLNKEFNRLLFSLLGLTNEIEKLIEGEQTGEVSYRILRRITRGFGRRFPYPLIRHLRYREYLKRTISPREKEELTNLEKKIHSHILTLLKTKSNRIQNILSDFEEKHDLSLKILEPEVIYVCSNCFKIICIQKFKKISCQCGKKIGAIEKTKRYDIHKFNRNTIDFINKGMWLEHGVDYLLRRKECQTRCGIHVLGHSGIWHEIDNIAHNKRENFLMFCECKTTDITVNEIFIFHGKMIDIGCNKGYMFTTSPNVTKEIKQFARSKNITIIESILEKKETQVIKDIKLS